jgi:protein-disulfide isomerase
VIGGSIVFQVLYHPSAQAPTAGGGAGGAAVGAAAGAAAQQGQASAAQVDKLGPRDVVLGDPNAKVTLVEYGDYQCPFCGMYFTQIEPTLKTNYITTGKVKMVFRDFPFLGPESLASGAAAQCATDQNQFWAYHDALYTAEVADGHENNGNLNRNLFVSLAKNIPGMDVTAFTTCLDSNKYASATADEYNAARNNGVNSTPTTFVNGVKVTDASGNAVGADVGAITQAIEAALKG